MTSEERQGGEQLLFSTKDSSKAMSRSAESFDG